MLNFIVNCILWTFAMYGIWQFARAIVAQSIHKRIESNGIYLIIAAKNQEQQVEMYVRSVAHQNLCNQEEILKNIIVTDLDSIDNTKAILEKLSDDYTSIKFVDWDELKNNLDNLK